MNWKFAGQRALKFQITIDNLFDVSYRDYLNRLRFYADEIGRNIQLMIKYNL
jgi:iron complex outermembrane receptor protein